LRSKLAKHVDADADIQGAVVKSSRRREGRGWGSRRRIRERAREGGRGGTERACVGIRSGRGLVVRGAG
jgi:hypothetical protein